MTGLYWNKKLAKELGITEAPVTVADLEADMKKATDAGKLAMMMPAKEGGMPYIYQALLTNYEGRDTVQNWIIQKDGATFNAKGALKAAQKIKDWQDAGYFSKDALALDGSTALSRFSNGEALFFPAGSWYTASINDALGDDAGWIAYPGEKADSGSAAANAVSPHSVFRPTPSTRTPRRHSWTSSSPTRPARSQWTTAIRRWAKARPRAPTTSCWVKC